MTTARLVFSLSGSSPKWRGVMAEVPAFSYGRHSLPWRETISDVAVSALDGTLLVSPPSSDPLEFGVVPDGVTPSLYQVPSTGNTTEDHERAMKETEGVLNRGSKLLCGFMISQDFPSLLSPMISTAANNGGDPWTTRGAPFYFKPKWFERNVLDYYASLWNAKWPHNPSDLESYWGYIVTMGSTEGNLHALWAARNYLSGRATRGLQQEVEMARSSSVSAALVSKEPVVLFSRNGHSSLDKLCDVINIPTFDVVGRKSYVNQNPLGGRWVAGVPCNGGDAGPGTMDIDALEKLVDFFSCNGHPLMVIFSYGTTIKCACDDVKTAGERLVNILKKNNMYTCKYYNAESDCTVLRRGFWFHVDGALAAAYMPFLHMAYNKGMTNIEPASVFDFRLEFISSVVMSGHKYIGTPWPCGVYMVQRLKQLPALRRNPYTEADDTTISQSRNAHSAIILWSFISTNSFHAQVKSVLACYEVLKYALLRLKELEKRIGIALWIKNSLPSLSIMFRRPRQELILKYALITCWLHIDSEKRPFAEIFIMRHVTNELIDTLISDLESPNSFMD